MATRGLLDKPKFHGRRITGRRRGQKTGARRNLDPDARRRYKPRAGFVEFRPHYQVGIRKAGCFDDDRRKFNNVGFKIGRPRVSENGDASETKESFCNIHGWHVVGAAIARLMPVPLHVM